MQLWTCWPDSRWRRCSSRADFGYTGSGGCAWAPYYHLERVSGADGAQELGEAEQGGKSGWCGCGASDGRLMSENRNCGSCLSNVSLRRSCSQHCYRLNRDSGWTLPQSAVWQTWKGFGKTRSGLAVASWPDYGRSHNSDCYSGHCERVGGSGSGSAGSSGEEDFRCGRAMSCQGTFVQYSHRQWKADWS